MCPWTDRDKGKDSDCHLESGDSGGGRDWMHLNRGSADGSSNRLLSSSESTQCMPGFYLGDQTLLFFFLSGLWLLFSDNKPIPGVLH